MEETVSHVAERGQSLIISQSQYAKVIFHDIADTYPTDADICCRYSLTDGVTVSNGDRIALYRVGWTSVQEHIVSECVPETDATELQVLFKASQLPKDENEFYQLCYVTRNGRVRGASVPFQFCPLFESELCVVEEADGMVVVRSRTAFTEEKLREVFVANEILQKEKGNLEKELQIFKEKYHKVSTELQSAMETLAKLENEKQALENGLEENLRMERYVECLKQDLLVNDKEKNQCLARLNKAEHDVQVLTATVDTLSADKEFMAQLLLSENKSGGVGAEICQFKGQVDSLTCMLEALSQSKELVTQELQMQQAVGKKLQQDVQRLESESREQQNKIEELQKENVILQEQTLCAEKTSEEKIEQMSGLEKEKECLLRKLDEAVRNTEREVLMVTEVYKRRLKEVGRQTSGLQTNIIWSEKEAEERTKEIVDKNHLKKDFVEAECVISESKQSLAQIMGEKASLEDNLAKALDREKKLLDHNECLATHLKELENEVSSLKLQLQMLNNECEKKSHFKEVATDLAHRITDLKIAHKEIVANRNMQLQRIDAIAERLSELDFEKMKLCCERTDMSTFCDVREDELAKMVENLTSVERRLKNSYLMGSFSDSSDAESLKESVDELLSFVASHKMRIVEIDQQMKEMEDETSVLLQQQSDALERKNEFKLHEEELHNKLIELQERESEMVREQADQLVTLHDQLDHTLNQNSEMLATGSIRKEKLASAVKDKAKLQQKLEELSRLQEQSGSENALEMNTCLEEEQQLKSRLQLAAVEYKKLYTEKQKVERRLAKLCHKLNNKRGKPLPASEQSEAKYQPATGELISLTGYSDEFQE